MGKYFPVNHLTLKLIDNLRPDIFDNLDQAQTERQYLKFAQMKVTSRLARYNFDLRAFLIELDEDKNNHMSLSKLFGCLAEKFSVYFSVQEQLTIRNAIYPGSN